PHLLPRRSEGRQAGHHRDAAQAEEIDAKPCRTAGERPAVRMTDLLQLLIAGLATGAIYALAAIGFTLLWQTSQTINFAQGEFVMVPAFFALVAMNFGLSFLPALIAAVLVSMLLLGVAFRYVVVGPLLNRGVLPLVISTIALSIILKESAKDFYSAEAQVFP